MADKTLDPGDSTVLVEVTDGVGVITLNRPEARNAFTPAMGIVLGNALAMVETDPDVRCVVLTGAGKGFCAGGDVKNMAEEGDGTVGNNTLDEAIHKQRLNHRATSGALFRMPKPTLAALPGAAAGAGLAFALACDMRIMVSSAVMMTAFKNVGFSGDYGGTYFMSQLVGTAKARELYFLSPRITSADALSLGLTNWVCEPDELMDRAMTIARELAAGPTIAFRYMKENLNRALTSGDLDDCMDLEATHHLHCGQTEDHQSAARAFVEKKTPVFNGR
jgi:2-(1,2-epoxy-1,2-dihydrophenyl)acetyl-CoA isomerase